MINDVNVIENSADKEYDMNIYTHAMRRKNYTYLCSECDSINHKIDMYGTCSVHLSCDTLSDDEKMDILYKSNPILNFDNLELYCPKCNKKTNHYAVDANIVNIVKALHDKGYTTKYSCEGHYSDHGCSTSYFMILGYVGNKFDLSNSLISNWYVESTIKEFGIVTILRIDIDKISMKDFLEQKHLDNMLCYIEDYM